MATNDFLDLPLPVLNGTGAAVDTSGMGSPKTIEVVGEFPGATIAVEVSEDAGVSFAPICVFQDVGGTQVLPVVAQRMRLRVRGRKSTVPFAANADVGAPAATPQFASIAIPAGNGPGAPTDISAFGEVIGVVVGGDFPGARVTIEISEDGADYAPFAVFAAQGGFAGSVVTANFIRANVAGKKSSVPFSATADVGGVAGSNAAIDGITVQDEGVDILGNPHQTLNFVGDGVDAADAGGGVATITIPGGIDGVAVDDEGIPIGAGPFVEFDFVGAGVIATDIGGGVARITIPGGGGISGINVENEGGVLPGSPYTTMNFVGVGVVASDDAGVAKVTIIDAVIFDDSVAGTNSNIRSDRAANQSPIDNTKSEITNLGSQTHTVNPGATGVTATGGTIVGGDDNSVSGDYGVAGGAGNNVSGDRATAFGSLNDVSGDRGTAFGNTNGVSNDDGFAAGVGNDVQGIGAAAIGDGNVAIGDGSVALGQINETDGAGSVALGQEAKAARNGQVAMAAGSFANTGDAQTAVWAERGDTPGLLPSEVVILEGGNGSAQFVIDPAKAYMVKIYAVAGGVVHGDADVNARAVFEFAPILTYVEAGVATMQPAGPIVVPVSASDPDAADWTMEASVAGGILVLKFTTGADAAIVRCVASVITTEMEMA